MRNLLAEFAYAAGKLTAYMGGKELRDCAEEGGVDYKQFEEALIAVNNAIFASKYSKSAPARPESSGEIDPEIARKLSEGNAANFTSSMGSVGDCIIQNTQPFETACCNFRFIGMNHSPELNGMCRHCNGQWKGVTSE